MARTRRRSWFALGVVLALGLVSIALISTGAGASSQRSRSHRPVPNVGHQETVKLKFQGRTNVRRLVTPKGTFVVGGNNPETELVPEGHELEKQAVAAPSAVPTPTPKDSPILVKPNPFGWEGIDHADQRFAGGGNQFSLEPPDQALCVGNVSPNGPADGIEVVESVNDAIAFYDSTTHQFGLPLTLSEFFGLPPTIDRTTGTFGPFVSDPKCYFDTATQRWFVTVLTITQDPVTGDLIAPATTYIAVSTSSEALGSYFIFALDATDVDHAGCPCFGDQPLIGADQYGFYVSTAEYALDCFTGGGCAFNGPQIYAFDKAALEAGTATSAVHFDGLTHVQGGRTTGTVQPSTTPNGVFETAQGGTEYFLSGFDCVPAPGCPIAAGNFNEITIWALTNTSSLTTTPALSLSLQDLQSEAWGTPVAQIQRDGPRPLGEEVGEPVPPVNANDSRMNQVVFANGRLWSGINTIVNPGPRDGIAWFIVGPSVATGVVSGVIKNQGYVSAARSFLSFPSVGVGDSGRGLIAFSLMGPESFPSAAQIAISPAGVKGAIQVVQPGFRSEDGFTCYVAFGGGLCRWGDYSASVATPDGTVFSATEMIGDNSRSFFANWSTFIWPTTP